MQALLSAGDAARIPGAVFLDARFRLQDASAAERLFRDSHLPGALRIDLETELSGPKAEPSLGRHPFPDRAALAARLGQLGISRGSVVLCYDDSDHAGAARAWALLRWLGHERCAVIDGGLRAWREAGLPLAAGGAEPRGPCEYAPGESLLLTRPLDGLSGAALYDVRAPERYRGEREPIDPVAGHIPGARNLPYASLLGADGRFLAAAELARLLPGPGALFYCGSGVTACVAVLACASIGREAGLFPGSWSAWCNSPGCGVATGRDPG